MEVMLPFLMAKIFLIAGLKQKISVTFVKIGLLMCLVASLSMLFWRIGREILLRRFCWICREFAGRYL